MMSQSQVKEFNQIAFEFLEQMINTIPDDEEIRTAFQFISTIRNNPDPEKEALPLKKFYAKAKPFAVNIQTLHENPDWIPQNAHTLPWISNVNIDKYWPKMPSENKKYIAEVIQDLWNCSEEYYQEPPIAVSKPQTPATLEGLFGIMQTNLDAKMKEQKVSDPKQLSKQQMSDAISHVTMETIEQMGGPENMLEMFTNPTNFMSLISGIRGITTDEKKPPLAD